MSVLISFSGLPGVGKTTVARALAGEVSAVYVRVDSIEAALKNSRLQIHPAEDAGYLAAVAVAKDNLAIGLDVVADTVNPIGVTRNWWAQAALASNARLLNVEIICSDHAEHTRRIEQRRSDIAGLDLPDWNSVQRRGYEVWSEARVLLDSSKMSVNGCVKRIVEAIATLECD
ncbi:putative kinase [Nitrobacter vulgaris]|uniref:AAA family ATPase n=1 Tax=Nitrobacter vulgaris TaxID=29421 RepID=UPI0028637741|nr:AAA family ATPase [Nitrobacter vulgaris]MDR6302537.1 putative kinase [Nitrobacter vulgaris]